MKFVNSGYGNVISADRIVAIVLPDAAPIRRMVQEARDAGRVVDATCGHKTRSVVVTDTGLIVLSPLLPDTLTARMEQHDPVKT